MARRTSRKRTASASAGGATAPRSEAAAEVAPSEPAAAPRGYARSRARDEAVRAQLRPFAPGERPRAVTVACVVAVLLAALVIAGAATGSDLSRRGGSWPGAIVIAGLLLVATWGMWRLRYWAVLGFQGFLCFQILVTALALVVASNVFAAVLCVAVIVLSGWLFWKLIRTMARLQVPDRPIH